MVMDFVLENMLTRFKVPLPTEGILIVIALIWGWLSDGPLKGARWPFIYIGAVITVNRLHD